MLNDSCIKISCDATLVSAALCAVAAKDATRRYLEGVFLDARGYIVALNGYIAFAARCASAINLRSHLLTDDLGDRCPPGIIVPAPALKAAMAAGRTKEACITVERDVAGKWCIKYGAACVAFDPIAIAYPDWMRVIPQEPKTLTAAHYNPRYIQAIGDMSKALLRAGKKGVGAYFKIHQAGDNAALVTFPCDGATVTEKTGPRTDCLAVIMPMRAPAGADAGFTDAFLTH
jgi:hypothetical protein